MKTLKRSFIALFLFLFFAFLVAFSLLSKAEYETRKLEAIENRAKKLSELLFEVAHLDEVFLLNKEQKTIDKYYKLVAHYSVLKTRPINFTYLYLTHTIKHEEIPLKMAQFIENIDDYIDYSQELFEEQKILGLNHESGLYGSFRDEVHVLHNYFNVIHNIELELMIYKMRRHEKDFMLRGLNKYLKEYNEQYKILRAAMQTLKDYRRDLMIEKLDQYYKNFSKLAEVSKIIGYTNNANGILQHLSSKKVLINQYYNELVQELIAHKEQINENNTFYYSFISVLIFLLIIQLYMAKTNIDRAKDNNPLTGLNGNRKIEDYLKYIVKKKSSRLIIYFDFDNFKPFNDKFGFKIGDDAIFIFSEILKKYFAKEKHFIGHIGGDDFIVIIDKADLEKSLKHVNQVIKDFEDYVRTFYTQEEQESNSVMLKDRFGVMRELSLLSVSAAIVQITENHVVAYDEILSETIAKVKKSSKISKVAITTVLDQGKSIENK